MISITDKRLEYKYWIDLGTTDITIYEKTKIGFICIYDNVVPANVGIVFNYEDIKHRIKPIDEKYNSKISVNYYNTSCEKEVVDFEYKLDQITGDKIIIGLEDFDYKKFSGYILETYCDSIYRILYHEGEIKIFTDYFSEVSYEEDLETMKYLGKTKYTFSIPNIRIKEPFIILELF